MTGGGRGNVRICAGRRCASMWCGRSADSNSGIGVCVYREGLTPVTDITAIECLAWARQPVSHQSLVVAPSSRQAMRAMFQWVGNADPPACPGTTTLYRFHKTRRFSHQSADPLCRGAGPWLAPKCSVDVPLTFGTSSSINLSNVSLTLFGPTVRCGPLLTVR
ncbi:hypothetical protein CC80DRAFT_37259 [Byssothecium circinans]|uniref:Uncharacterized protein n=1 Tax=Byssothecium circinans TaxID=147558 RepID=A0A6A5U0W5_9PLEO|nr:hypothetical protein CC80DRAFT_37259 [Byssothecium circinans]